MPRDVLISIFRPDEAGTSQILDEAFEQPGDDAARLWIDFDGRRTDHEELYALLKPMCGDDLTPEGVHDLLNPDSRPELRSHQEGRVRTVTGVAVFAITDEAPGSGGQTQQGRLVFELVQCLAAERWLITAWHPRLHTETVELEEGERHPRQRVRKVVRRKWCETESRSMGDLGVLLIHELTRTYSRARSELHDQIYAWEKRFFALPDPDELKALVALRNLLAEFQRGLIRLNLPTHDIDEGRSWFSDTTDSKTTREADDLINRSLRDLAELTQNVRSDFNLVQGAIAQNYREHMREQSRQSREQSRQSEGLRRAVETITAIILVPSLVASVFGANTAIFGGEGTQPALAIMLLLMVAAGGLTLIYLRWRQRRDTENYRDPVTARRANEIGHTSSEVS